MMEIVKDDYLLRMGFTQGFIKRNASKMGSLHTRPRLFDKEKLHAYLKGLCYEHLIEVHGVDALPPSMRKQIKNVPHKVVPMKKTKGNNPSRPPLNLRGGEGGVIKDIHKVVTDIVTKRDAAFEEICKYEVALITLHEVAGTELPELKVLNPEERRAG